MSADRHSVILVLFAHFCASWRGGQWRKFSPSTPEEVDDESGVLLQDDVHSVDRAISEGSLDAIGALGVGSLPIELIGAIGVLEETDRVVRADNASIEGFPITGCHEVGDSRARAREHELDRDVRSLLELLFGE